MKRLHVSLAYRPSDFARHNDPDSDMALPVKALDTDGTVLDEGSASASQPAELRVSDETGMAFVRLTWPSGRSETKRTDLSKMNDAWVSFSDAAISRNEWSAWAVPQAEPPDAPREIRIPGRSRHG